VRAGFRASEVIYRIRGLQPLQAGAINEGARGDQWSEPRCARTDA
jgi:hypothetical protein